MDDVRKLSVAFAELIAVRPEGDGDSPLDLGDATTALAECKAHGGKTSLRFESFTKGNESGNARVSKKVAVKPWQQYHLSAWVRTKDLSPPARSTPPSWGRRAGR